MAFQLNSCGKPGHIMNERYPLERDVEEDDGAEKESLIESQRGSGKSYQYGGPHIHMVNPDEYQQYIQEHPDEFLLYGTSWCGHCKALAPEYEKAAQQLEQEHSNVELAAVDCVAYADFCKAQGVEGYPTVRYFHNGQMEEYKGGRTAKDLVDYAHIHAQGAAPAGGRAGVQQASSAPFAARPARAAASAARTPRAYSATPNYIARPASRTRRNAIVAIPPMKFPPQQEAIHYPSPEFN